MAADPECGELTFYRYSMFSFLKSLYTKLPIVRELRSQIGFLHHISTQCAICPERCDYLKLAV